MTHSRKTRSASAAKQILVAQMTSFTTIAYTLSHPADITIEDIRLFRDGKAIKALAVQQGMITLAEAISLSATYILQIRGFGKQTVIPTHIFDTPEFIRHYTYDGDDLGAWLHGDGSTTFKLWAPTASRVVLNLFTAGQDVEAYANWEMRKADRGIWTLNVPETGHGTYYTYSVTTAQGTQEAVDPYAKSCGANGQRGMVVDLAATDPENWRGDRCLTLEKYTDATIWEIHVRDFSNAIATSRYPGKFLAFTEHGLTNSGGLPIGVDYLKNLGISHIHLLPVFDYATVDEENPGFNWGYDPHNFNCLEGSYATDPRHGEVRVTQFKQMIRSLHADGLGVIMDVVYNHTYHANSSLNKAVPYYYYRFDAAGKHTGASCCGNDTASERYMYRKYMVDSAVFLVSQYHLDGLRFDLMGLHDVATMQDIERAVHKINPHALLYGEAWNMAGDTTSATMMTQENASLVTASPGAAGAVAVFNDTIRDGLKGSVWDAIPHGYINGNFRPNTAAVQFTISGGSISGPGWTAKNANLVNYMSCHDNMTLWDTIAVSCPGSSVEERMARNRLGIGILMVSLGIPFWQAGEEMLRSKQGHHNSYNASDTINNLNWEALTPDSPECAMLRYYQGLIRMRKAYPIFRSDGSDVTIAFSPLSGGGIAACYQSSDGSRALVLCNPGDSPDTYSLEGAWDLVATGTQAGSEIIATETGSVTVEAHSIRIYVKD